MLSALKSLIERIEYFEKLFGNWGEDADISFYEPKTRTHPMNEPIIVGPLLGFEAGEYYTVCILTEPMVAPPTLKVSGKTKRLAFAKKATVGNNEFWRAEFKVTARAKGANIEYAIHCKSDTLTDLHGRDRWEFYVPGKTEQPKIAYASCNGFSSVKLVRDTNEPFALWQLMAATHQGTTAQAAQPFALLLLGGDQVYADDIWESKRCPSLKAWSDLSQVAQQEAKVTATMTTEIGAFYDWLYTDRWRDENMSLMFASIPSVMMWDDHDIFDGWGSYPEKRQNCAVFQAVFSHASRVFEVFQLRCSARNRMSPGKHHRTLAVRFRDYHILVLDNRSERLMDRIMSEENWRDVKNWLTGLAGESVRNLLVLTGVPVVYRSFSAVEAVIDTTPWNEEIEDDVHDHWSSRSHLAERMRLVMVLLNFLEQHTADKCKAVLLSGDVHVGALGQLWHARKELGITQVIASGIVHPPPSAFQWAGIQLMTADTPESLGDGDVTAAMLTPLGSPRYLRTRNFATLQTGTDNKIWVNWICENKNWKPSFAIS